MTHKLALIGCGNMGGAIVRGAVRSGTLEAQGIYLFDPSTDKMRQLSDDLGGANVCDSAADAIATADIIVFAVKPHMMKPVMADLDAELVASRAIIVSIAAGLSTSHIETFTPAMKGKRIIRIMPNVNAAIGMSVSGICGNSSATDEDVATVRSIFDGVGTTHLIDEAHFGVFAALAGCSPAWTYTYIDALAQAAVAHGLTKQQATQIAAAAVEGSAKMLFEEARDNQRVPQELVDRVCSPGGTTVAGLLAADDAGFSAAARAAVNAAVKRDAELG